MKLKTLVRIHALLDDDVEALMEARDDKYNELRVARDTLDRFETENAGHEAIRAARIEVARLEAEYAGIKADYIDAEEALDDLCEHDWH